jgi:hypothetical protein
MPHSFFSDILLVTCCNVASMTVAAGGRNINRLATPERGVVSSVFRVTDDIRMQDAQCQPMLTIAMFVHFLVANETLH